MEVSQALIDDLLRAESPLRSAVARRGHHARGRVRHAAATRLVRTSAAPARSLTSLRDTVARRSGTPLSRRAAGKQPMGRPGASVTPLLHVPGSELLLRCVLGTHTWGDVETGRGVQRRCCGCGTVSPGNRS